MMLVTKRDRLIANDVNVSRVGRAGVDRHRRAERGKEEDRPEDRYLRDGVETAVKNLRQGLRPPDRAHSLPTALTLYWLAISMPIEKPSKKKARSNIQSWCSDLTVFGHTETHHCRRFL